MRTGKIYPSFGLRLIGATQGAIGLYLTAFQYNIIGAVLLELGGILLAIGGKL